MADSAEKPLAPWRERQPLPCPVDPNCTIDHLRRKKNRTEKKGGGR